MDWTESYADRIMGPDEAVSCIESNQRVFVTGNCSMPKTIMEALVKRAWSLENVELCHALTFGCAEYVDDSLDGHLRVNSLFVGPNVREAVNEGRADFTPVLLSRLPLLFRDGVLPLDVAFVHLSPPDAHGFCSYGIEAGLTKTAAESARTIVAQINPHMPRTHGDAFIHVSRLHRIVQVHDPLLELPQSRGELSEVHRRIGQHIAELIPDGATLQLGIGEIPDAVLHYLSDKRDLGLHTEMFSDGVMGLVEQGVLTGARKTLHPGKLVAGFVIGSRALYDWVNDNAQIELYPNEYVNDPFVIAKNARQVAINSAISIDLTGQVCADSIGPRIYSGVGGQLDFVTGAAASPGGRPIIALPSTAQGGKTSRIVPMLEQGSGVVTTRNHVHWIVTEHGAANLYGRTLRERARALIGLAAPEFRADLTAAARKLHYL